MSTTSMLCVSTDDPTAIRYLARQVAAACGFGDRPAWLVAIGASEVAAEASAHADNGSVEFRISSGPRHARLQVVVQAGASGQDPGDWNPRRLALARRVADTFEVEARPGGPSKVVMTWSLPSEHVPDIVTPARTDESERVRRENQALFEVLASSATVVGMLDDQAMTSPAPHDPAGSDLVLLDNGTGAAALHYRSDAVVAERTRIGRDLHHRVIQRLFAAGLGLQAGLLLDPHPEVALRVRQAIAELDDTIRQIRSTVFALTSVAQPAAILETELLELVTSSQELLGFRPRVSFQVQIHPVVPAAIAELVLAACKEALSNAARHAQATSIEVLLSTGPDIVLEVVDDGLVIGDAQWGDQLVALANYVERFGGSFTATEDVAKGTRLAWRVPVGGEGLHLYPRTS